MPPLPDRYRSKAVQGSFKCHLGRLTRVAHIAALPVSPALYAGHGGHGSDFGGAYRYQAQPLHRGEKVADFLPPHVPFFRKSGFRELQLSGL
ncbi:hypothetical protein NXU83_15880 [Bacteroides thetaiotaomicron]|uniref:Uncharacterized protein n=1 Tax=Phocaeicola vulgatus TaxID=821 RepID=A0A7Y6PF42_PHOVU|nr:MULTISPECIES: hypothetical protein [Bacteroidaceae]MCE8943009.1 hypothetical protein [Bacteroides faecis]MCE9012192.1 hypothetical protein [Bacteroides faecis]MCS2255118.1 hypothetical protein [Bacteroides thetaiotaomicron]MCS2480782.1 hypothetical protein [Bacteroides faecis]MCS3182997.1 hypothetical protein [Bacteroides thetaiotaomicron]